MAKTFSEEINVVIALQLQPIQNRIIREKSETVTVIKNINRARERVRVGLS